MFHNDVVKKIVNNIPYYYYNNLEMTHLLHRERHSTVWYGGDLVTFRNSPHVNVGHKFYEGDVVTLCNVPHENVGYKYLLPFTYDFRL